MKLIHELLNNIAAQERKLLHMQFLAPCVPGGSIRTCVARLVYTFAAQPANFEGWGIFMPQNALTAQFVREASLPDTERYRHLLAAVRLHLLFRLRGRTWLALPATPGTGKAEPVAVHLVEDGAPLDTVIARRDGSTYWFDSPDRRASPVVATQLREYLRSGIPAADIHVPGLTPEHRAAYILVLEGLAALRARQQRRTDEHHLREALAAGGGSLSELYDRDSYWLVDWCTPDGERHHSAIDKRDLTVISAGICLSGEDRQFDLQSLVGVVTQRPDWMRDGE